MLGVAAGVWLARGWARRETTTQRLVRTVRRQFVDDRGPVRRAVSSGLAGGVSGLASGLKKKVGLGGDRDEGLAAKGGRALRGGLEAVGGGLSEGAGVAASTAASAGQSVVETAADLGGKALSALGTAGAVVGKGAVAAANRVGDTVSRWFSGGEGRDESAGGGGITWRQVQDYIDRARAHGPDEDEEEEEDRGGVAVGRLVGGSTLLLAGLGTYYLFLSPAGPDRRVKLISGVQDWVGSAGKMARSAGSALMGRGEGGGGEAEKRGRQPQAMGDVRPGDEQGSAPSQKATPIDHPAELIERVRQVVETHTSDRSDVHVTIRDGVVVVQGTASPEEYDGLVRAIKDVTDSFVNELAAISPV